MFLQILDEFLQSSCFLMEFHPPTLLSLNNADIGLPHLNPKKGLIEQGIPSYIYSPIKEQEPNGLRNTVFI